MKLLRYTLRRPGIFLRAVLISLLAVLTLSNATAQTTTVGAGNTQGTGVKVGAYVPGVPTLPPPPPNAMIYNDLQNEAGNPGVWTVNTSQSGSTGTCSTCTATISFTQSSPSLSGASMKIEINNTSTTKNFYWNGLFNRHLGRKMAGGGSFPPTHFETDLWAYFVAGQNVECYEYDPDIYHNDGQFFMSWQLCPAGKNTNHLRLYSKIARGWQSSTFARPSLAPGVWHHIQTYGTMDPTHTDAYPYGSYTYVDFIYDGMYVYHNLNLTYGAGFYPHGENTNIEMQLDSRKPIGGVAPGLVTEYLDNYNAIFW